MTRRLQKYACAGAAFPDLDASPTKAWMILHREDLDVEPLYQLAFGKRPREELYHLPSDPAYMNNLATDPDHEAVRAELQVRAFILHPMQQHAAVHSNTSIMIMIDFGVREY